MLAGLKVRDLHAHAYAVHAASKTLKRPHACFRPISLLNKNNCCQYQIGIIIIIIIILASLWKIPAIHLFNLSTLKGRLRKYKLTSLWNTGKGLQEAAQSKVEYTTWHGCTQYSIVTWSEWGLPQLQIIISNKSQGCYFAAWG